MCNGIVCHKIATFDPIASNGGGIQNFSFTHVSFAICPPSGISTSVFLAPPYNGAGLAPNETPGDAGAAQPNESEGVGVVPNGMDCAEVALNETEGAGVAPKETDGVVVSPGVFPNEGADVEPELNGFVFCAGIDDPLPKLGVAGVDAA